MAPNAADDDLNLGGEEGEEEVMEVPESPVGMDPNHPLLARAQKALKDQQRPRTAHGQN